VHVVHPLIADPHAADAAAAPTPSGSPRENSPLRPWIYNPAVDLLIGCGAWSAPLLLLAFFASNSHQLGWTVGFYFVALLFNYPHFMATVYRAYHTHTEFAKYRLYTVHIALLLLAAGVVAHLWYPLLPWIFTLYIFWSPWHYTGQNFGLLMLFARRSGISPSVAERRALRLAFVASFLMLMLSFNTGASVDPLILSLGLPAKITLPLRLALAVVFFLATTAAFVSLRRRATFRSLAPSMLLAITQFLWFLLPALIELSTAQDVPQTRYSSGILAVLHSTQYLWITSYFQRKEALAAGNARWKFSTYLLTLVAGGIALFIPGPWLVSRLFHADFASSFLTFTALVNIHHFILDGALWKLRDTRIAALLVQKDQQQSPQPANPATAIIARLRWFAGSAPLARAVRISAVIALFAVAAVDQLHFYWSNRVDRLDALQRAAQLNPDDSALQLRLAKAAAQAGQPELKLTALRSAAAINPANLNVQENLARGLIETQKIPEAYAQYQTLLRRWPDNPNALVNSGLLAHQLGRDSEAVDDWQRAIAVDPRQARAHLYLAQFFEQQAQLQSAARHYRAYTQLVAQNPADFQTPDAPSLLAIQIKIADADAAANQAPQAQQEYSAAIQQGQVAGDRALQSLALAHLAELQEKESQVPAAAQSFHQALGLDAGLADRHAAAIDWFNYSQFLRRQGQPEESVFAGLLHAENLLPPGNERSAISQSRAASEVRLSFSAAANIRATLDQQLKKALNLPAQHDLPDHQQ
jgi:tetratricopeptide (TPR) repeat protein